MTTYTTIARLPVITPLDPAVRGAWGPLINSAWSAVEQLAAGNGSINLTGLTAYTLTVANDSADQARQAMLSFTGTPSGTCTVTIPAISRIGWAANGTTQAVQITAGGAALSIPVGMSVLYTVSGTTVTSVPIGFLGAVKANGALTVTGLTTANGGLTVSGATNITGALVVSGATNITGALGVGGSATVAVLGVSTSATITGALGVGGAVGVIGLTTAYGGLTVAGTTGITLTGPASGGNVIKYNTFSGFTEIQGTSTGLKILSNGVLNATFLPIGTVVFNGEVDAVGYVTTSDRRAKADIADITTEDAYAWVRAGRARTYTLGGRQHAGFIAQEDIANGRGAAVSRVADDRPLYAAGDGYVPNGTRLARNYEMDIPYLTRALAAALVRIEQLEAAVGAA